MGVGYWQQAGSLLQQPTIAGCGLALRTMPIAAGVVSDGFVVTAIAPFQMSAQCGGAALANVTQNLPLLARDDMASARKEGLLMSAKDVGHFEPMFAHGVRLPPEEY